MNARYYHPWTWDRPSATVRDGRGPERVDTSTPDPDYTPRPVGFTAPLTEAVEPKTWDGDNS